MPVGLAAGVVTGAVAVGVTVGGADVICRYDPEAQPSCPAQRTGYQPAIDGPVTGTVVPSRRVVIWFPAVDGAVRQRSPRPPVPTTLAEPVGAGVTDAVAGVVAVAVAVDVTVAVVVGVVVGVAVGVGLAGVPGGTVTRR